MARSGSRRLTRQAAPSTSRAASASASRSSTVPLLPISPAVRSHSPTRCPSAACLATMPPMPISMSSGCGPMASRSTGCRRAHRVHPNDVVALSDSPCSGAREDARGEERAGHRVADRCRARTGDAGSCGAGRCTSGRRRSRRTTASHPYSGRSPEIAGYIVSSSYISCPVRCTSDASRWLRGHGVLIGAGDEQAVVAGPGSAVTRRPQVAQRRLTAHELCAHGRGHRLGQHQVGVARP